MKRETIFNGLKDLILTLKSVNIERDEILSLWLTKYKELEKEIDNMNSCDMLWLSEEYETWYTEEIVPLDEELKSRLNKFKREEFPWV